MCFSRKTVLEETHLERGALDLDPNLSLGPPAAGVGGVVRCSHVISRFLQIEKMNYIYSSPIWGFMGKWNIRASPTPA